MSRVVPTVAVGLVLFLLFAVAFAPATLIRTFLPPEAGVELLQPSGTLWNGSAALYLAGQPAGRLDWKLAPRSLLRGALGYDLAIGGPGHDLHGAAEAGLGSADITLVGRASAAFANQWLAPYDIAIGGELGFRETRLRVPYDLSSGIGSASGSLTWTGGPVDYRLGGRPYAGELPPLVGHLGEGLEAVVFPEGGQTPLLEIEMLENGFLRIGVTQLLTRLAGNPWPGSSPDHEIVLEVEEQLF